MSKKHIGHQTLETMGEAVWYNEWLIQKVKKYLRGDILEVGFGIGSFSKKLSDFGNITAIDIDDVYLRSSSSKKVKYGFGDIETGKYFFKNRKFDCLVCVNVLEHIKKDENAMVNMYKLLKEKGTLILLVPAHMSLFSKFDKRIGHFRRYDVDGIKILGNKAGFSTIQSRYINWWAAIGWFVFVKLLNRKSLPGWPVKVFDKFGSLFLSIESYLVPPFGLSVLVVLKK